MDHFSGGDHGVLVSNRPIGPSLNAASVDIEGMLPPDWDVELYRNDVLIDFETTGSDGCYEFRYVPIISSKDELRLALFGPQGQISEQTIPISPETNTVSRFTYDVSLTQQGRRLSHEITGTTSSSQEDGIRGSGRLVYLINPNLSTEFNTSTFNSANGQDGATEVNITYRPNGALVRMGAVRVWSGGEAIRGEDRFGPISFRLNSQLSNEFASSADADNSASRKFGSFI